eukprot:TRINITY_DN57464_c0_g1_i1.p1 TRINITY_DN57464_c0_g1~~TRINITY_DN57464_c0_g1_i1.p1  ORF type:complete len:256 (-),score=34.21 TRINITY_DN57464_c0_g1_i1:100-867(-)
MGQAMAQAVGAQCCSGRTTSGTLRSLAQVFDPTRDFQDAPPATDEQRGSEVSTVLEVDPKRHEGPTGEGSTPVVGVDQEHNSEQKHNCISVGEVCHSSSSWEPPENTDPVKLSAKAAVSDRSCRRRRRVEFADRCTSDGESSDDAQIGQKVFSLQSSSAASLAPCFTMRNDASSDCESSPVKTSPDVSDFRDRVDFRTWTLSEHRHGGGELVTKGPPVFSMCSSPTSSDDASRDPSADSYTMASVVTMRNESNIG